MTISKLDVIVLGVLSVLALAIVGAYALVHPNHAIPSDLVALTTLVLGGLAGRAMPALTSADTSATSSTPAGNELTGVVSALTDTLGAVLANPDTDTSDQTSATATAAAASVAPAVPVRPVLPAPAPGQAAVAPNTVQAQ
jgi:hypothetical protein